MWICNNCDTKNEESNLYCACCGEIRPHIPVPPSEDKLVEWQYQKAKSLMQSAKTEAEYQQTIQKLAALNSYRDAEVLIRLCNERIAQLNEDNYRQKGNSSQSTEIKREKKGRDWTDFLLVTAVYVLFLFFYIRSSGSFAAAWEDIQFKIAFIFLTIVEVIFLVDEI